jgi:DNA-binding transcriptional ArsR family regulator
VTGIPDISSIAKAISEPSRAAMLTALLDGRLHPASSLAYIAGIKPQTASFHLKRMTELNLISVERHGRHRYYGLTNYEVASTLESFLVISPKTEIKSFRQATQDKAIRDARTCYDHLAGKLGVKITDSMLVNGYLENLTDSFIITEKGEEFFAGLHIDLSEVKKSRRKFINKCLDWSERRHHLSGAVGNALFEKFLELNWIEKASGTRAVKLTSEGKKKIQLTFCINLDT